MTAPERFADDNRPRPLSSVEPIPEPVQRRQVTTVLGEQEIRMVALRDAISYFTYVERAAGPAAPPIGARTVLGMADHFAAYIRTGVHPDPEG